MAKLVAVNELRNGDVLAKDVYTDRGKSLLSRGMVLSERTITLLGTWDIRYVEVFEEQAKYRVGVDATPNIVEACLRFFEEYESVVSMTDQAFDFVRDQKKIPIQFLRDTSFGIYSSILEKGSLFMDYLMITDYKLADKVTRHSIMVSYIAAMIARQLRMPNEDVEGVALAGLLHDIGKLIQTKAGDLDLKTHVLNAGALLQDMPDISKDVFYGVIQHHELLDGTGYPMGVKGERIHPYAKIVAVADLFHTKAYIGEHTNPFPVLEYLTKEMFTKYDGAVCRVFLKRTRDSLLHSHVILGDDRGAEIIFYNSDMETPCYPIVRTQDNEVIDLAVNKDIKIKHIIIPEFFPLGESAG